MRMRRLCAAGAVTHLAWAQPPHGTPDCVATSQLEPRQATPSGLFSFWAAAHILSVASKGGSCAVFSQRPLLGWLSPQCCQYPHRQIINAWPLVLMEHWDGAGAFSFAEPGRMRCVRVHPREEISTRMFAALPLAAHDSGTFAVFLVKDATKPGALRRDRG